MPLGRRRPRRALRRRRRRPRFASTQRDGSSFVRCAGAGVGAAAALHARARARRRLRARAADARAAGSLSPKPFAVLAGVTDSVAALGATRLPTRRSRSSSSSASLLVHQRLLAVAGVLERLNREAGRGDAVALVRVRRPRALQPVLPARPRAPGPRAGARAGAGDPRRRHFPYIDGPRPARVAALAAAVAGAARPGRGGAASRRRSRPTGSASRGSSPCTRNGLGTIDAMRRMTEAQLPVDVDAPRRSSATGRSTSRSSRRS